jgi:hypothetical protein
MVSYASSSSFEWVSDRNAEFGANCLQIAAVDKSWRLGVISIILMGPLFVSCKASQHI